MSSIIELLLEAMQGDALHPLQPFLSPRKDRFSVLDDVHQHVADHVAVRIELVLPQSAHVRGKGGADAGKGLAIPSRLAPPNWMALATSSTPRIANKRKPWMISGSD